MFLNDGSPMLYVQCDPSLSFVFRLKSTNLYIIWKCFLLAGTQTDYRMHHTAGMLTYEYEDVQTF